MRRSSSPPLDPAVAGRRPFGDGAGSELRRQTGSRRTTATATMDFEVRVEEEYHRLSSCPIPEFSTMATGDGDGDGAVLVGGAGGDWAVETGVVGIGERTTEERGAAEGRATEVEPRRGGERTARVGSSEPATLRFSRWSSDGWWSGVRMRIRV